MSMAGRMFVERLLACLESRSSLFRLWIGEEGFELLGTLIGFALAFSDMMLHFLNLDWPQRRSALHSLEASIILAV